MNIRDAPHAASVAPDRRSVAEAPRRTPVAADVDVLVAGGGPAGLGAALAAAGAGASVLIVERHQMLGGVWTAGLLNPLFDHRGKGYVVAELVERLQRADAWRDWRFSHCFDIEAMQRILEEWCDSVGVAYWYDARVVGAVVEHGVVRGALVESKSGREAVLARACIDATGDGDLAARAGAEYAFGRAVDGLTQPMTLMFEIDGLPPDWEQPNAEWLYDAMTEAIDRAGLPFRLPIERCNYAPWIIGLPRPGGAVVQHTHVYRARGTDTRDLTRAMVEARRLAHEAAAVFVRVPGFEAVRLVRTAPSVGVREARRILGDYVLSLDDLAAGARFEDAVTYGTFCVDIHEPAPGAGVPSGHNAPMRPYEIPYRCLLPRGLEGLLVAGRCLSGTHEAHASYRVTGTCMATGQAAGLAAAMAAAEALMPRALPGAAVNRALRELGAGML